MSVTSTDATMMTVVIRLHQWYPPQAGHRRPGNAAFLHLSLSRPPHLGSQAIVNSAFLALHSLWAALQVAHDAYLDHHWFSGKSIKLEVMTKVQQAMVLMLQCLHC